MASQAPTAQLPLDSIDPPARPHREAMDPGELGALADSMSASGLHQPIGVRGPDRDGRYEIVWGHRRIVAAQMLKWPNIEAKIFPPDYDPLVARTEENGLREQLNPREEARIVQEFKDGDYSLAATARLMRKSTAWVSSRLEILGWPQDVQEQLATGTLGIAVARELAAVDHDSYRRELLKEAERVGATARVATAWRAHYEADRERIVQNHMTVQAILERREAFYVETDCQSCRRRIDTRATVLLRICSDCNLELEQQHQAEDRLGATPASALPA